MASFFVYGLIDPRSGFVRYVGQSGDPLQRLRHHMSLGAGPVRAWLNSLAQEGVGATVVILWSGASLGEANEWERKWISHFAVHGHLLNDGERAHGQRACAYETINRGAKLLAAVVSESSQMAVSRTIGVRQPSVSQILNGGMPRLSTALAMRDAYGIPVEAWSQPSASPDSR